MYIDIDIYIYFSGWGHSSPVLWTVNENNAAAGGVSRNLECVRLDSTQSSGMDDDSCTWCTLEMCIKLVTCQTAGRDKLVHVPENRSLQWPRLAEVTAACTVSNNMHVKTP